MGRWLKKNLQASSKKNYRFFSWLICIELLFSPLSMTQAQDGSKPETGRTKRLTNEDLNDISKTIMFGTNIGKGILEGLSNAASNQAAANQYRLTSELLDPNNCGTATQKAPCVSEVFPECRILKSKPNIIEPDVCRNGVDPSDPASQTKFGSLQGYVNAYSQMENLYDNFQKDANQTTSTGLGCLNARADALARVLRKREEEIDNLINKMAEAQDNFKKQAQMDRDKIEEAQALLEGDNFQSPRSKAVLSKNSVRFEDQFTDPACAAVMSAEDLKKEGRGGLKGIESALSKITNQKDPSGGFSAMEFNDSFRTSLENDIRKMASVAQREVEAKGIDTLSQGQIKGIPSLYGLNNSPTFTAALEETSKEIDLFRADLENSVDAFLDRGDPLVTNLKNERADFEFALQNFERQEKMRCFRRQANIINLINGKTKMIDPRISKDANRNSEIAYRNLVVDVLNDDSGLSIEEKLERIKKAEAKQGNRNVIVELDKSATIDGESVRAINKLTPAAFIGLHVKNCQKQFENNPNSKGYTGLQVVNKMREARGKFQEFRRSIGPKVREQMIERMITCGDSQIGNAKGIAVCSAKELSPASTNFCTTRAASCASNMRTCLTKANQKVQEITKKRDSHIARYQMNIEKNRLDLERIAAQVRAVIMTEGMQISQTLKQSLTLPISDAGLKFSVKPEERQFLPGLEELEVEDPDQYFKLAKDKMLALKDSVAKQNRRVMNGDSDSGLGNSEALSQQGVYGHIRNIKKNMEDAVRLAARMKESCTAALQNFTNARKQMIGKQNEMINQRNARLQEFCGRYMDLNSMPGCDSKDNIGDIERGIKAYEVSGQPQIPVALGSREGNIVLAWNRYCRSRGDGNFDLNATTYAVRFTKSVREECSAASNQNISDACKPWTIRLNKCGESDELDWKSIGDKNFQKWGGSFNECLDSNGNIQSAKKNDPNCKIKRDEIVDFCKEERVPKILDSVARRLAAIKSSGAGVDDKEEWTKLTTQLGEKSPSVCTSMNGNDPVSKAYYEMSKTLAEGAALIKSSAPK
jgi:hypothetical protein